MLTIQKRLLQMAEPARLVLAAQEISTSGPGTIVTDVETMLHLIGPEGIPTQSKQGNLPTAALSALNQRLSAPIELQLNRPLLRDYPNLAGVYVLLRVMDIARAERGRLCLNQAALSFWTALTRPKSTLRF